MKDHMRNYFPERFEDNDKSDYLRNISNMVIGYNKFKRRIECEHIVARVWKNSDELRLLSGAMRKYGCNFSLARHVSCEECINCKAGFDPDTNQIIICENTKISETRVLTAMMHEMIHMFDYCRAKFDFNNLEHVACSEIRAANLTFCTLLDKMRFPGSSNMFDFKGTHQECVRDVATRSVIAYAPEVDPELIQNIVNRVFVGCYNDLEPFGRRGLNGSKDLKHSYRERFYYGYV